jgi:LPXTG-motif cell wall-anchored protein
MTTTVQRRSVILAGLILLSLLVFAVRLDTSQATRPLGTGAGGGGVTVTPLTQAQAGVALLKHGQLDRVHAAVAPATTVQVASTGGTSTTTWVILAVALAALAIGVWFLVRRRRMSRFAAPADSFCSLHPQDARCPAV